MTPFKVYFENDFMAGIDAIHVTPEELEWFFNVYSDTVKTYWDRDPHLRANFSTFDNYLRTHLELYAPGFSTTPAQRVMRFAKNKGLPEKYQNEIAAMQVGEYLYDNALL